MQSSLSPLAAYIVNTVLKNADIGTSAGKKLQLIGVLTVIIMLQRRGEIATSRSIALFLDADATVIGRNIKWLEKNGIVCREKVLNIQGRGHAYKIDLVETPELRELLGLAPHPQK